jgi:cytochrome b561
VSTAVAACRATAVAEQRKFTALTRILHWLTAILVFSEVLIGFVMVSSVSDHATLLKIHKILGVVLLIVTIVRVINRLTHRSPALPATVGRFERTLIATAEMALYALLLAQPLDGWAMDSASGIPVVVFGSLRLPAIAPVDPGLYSVLREAHSVLAFLLVAVVAAHVSAVLIHSIALRDGMLRRMTFRLPSTRPDHTYQSRRDQPGATASSDGMR